MIYQTIGVDVDEVLAQLHDPWELWIKERYGVGADWSNWHIDQTPGLDQKVFTFIRPSIYLDGTVEPYPEAYRALQLLRENDATIWFTTSCIGGTEEAKLDWLKGYGLFENDDVYKPGRDKDYPELDLLIDDRHKDCVDASCPAILINREWNEDMPFYWRADDILHAADQAIREDAYHFTI